MGWVRLRPHASPAQVGSRTGCPRVRGSQDSLLGLFSSHGQIGKSQAYGGVGRTGVFWQPGADLGSWGLSVVPEIVQDQGLSL